MKITFIANIKGIYLGYTFEPSSVITIGREIGNTIAPINVEGFSRRHARIFFRDGGWYIEDLGSTNGTYRNCVKIESATKLEKGDSIRCGLLEIASFNFGDDGETAPDPSAPPAAVTPAPSLPQMLAARKTEMSIKPVVPAAAPKAAAAMQPVADLPDPAAAAKPASPLSAAAPAIRRPAAPGAGGALKPGLKLPPKPGVRPGLKLPGKTAPAQ